MASDYDSGEQVTSPEGVRNAMAQVTVASIDACARAERVLAEAKRRQLVPTLLHPRK